MGGWGGGARRVQLQVERIEGKLCTYQRFSACVKESERKKWRGREEERMVGRRKERGEKKRSRQMEEEDRELCVEAGGWGAGGRR